MAAPLRLLVAEGAPEEAQAARIASTGETSGETYARTLAALEPDADIRRCSPARPGPEAPSLEGVDAVVLTGSPLRLWRETPERRREVEFVRRAFEAGTPMFGSCAGLQLAAIAAGGQVRPAQRRERGFARRLTRAEGAAGHPLLEGRPDAWDAPAVHADEVAALPKDARRLAGNAACEVQAAEIRLGAGVFWGVQYHPEISLAEVADALERETEDLIREGLARTPRELGEHLELVRGLARDPARLDLAWRLGLDEEVLVFARRTREIRNFLDRLVAPTRSARGRA